MLIGLKLRLISLVLYQVWPDSGKKRGYGYIEFDDEDAVSFHQFCSMNLAGKVSPCVDLHHRNCFFLGSFFMNYDIVIAKLSQVDKIVLVGIHIVGNCRLEARKGLSKEQQEAIR